MNTCHVRTQMNKLNRPLENQKLSSYIKMYEMENIKDYYNTCKQQQKVLLDIL